MQPYAGGKVTETKLPNQDYKWYPHLKKKKHWWNIWTTTRMYLTIIIKEMKMKYWGKNDEMEK